MLLLFCSALMVFQCEEEVCSLERCEHSPSWMLLRPGHHPPSLQRSCSQSQGGSGLRSLIAWCFLAQEFSQSPAKSIAGKFGAEQHGWVMLCIWLCGPALQLPLFCPVSSVAPPLYTSSTSPPVKLVEVPRLQLWQEGWGCLGLSTEFWPFQL